MLSRELKSFRIKNGYTQKSLAKKLGMGETSYSKRENGQISFTIDEVNELAKILNLDKEDILRIFFNHQVASKATKDINRIKAS